MSTLIQNLRGPIDSMHIAAFSRKLHDPADAPVFAKECLDMLDNAPTEDIKAEMSLKMAREILSHTKDEKVRGAAAATLNLKEKGNDVKIAACHAALSMITGPISGSADSVTVCASSQNDSHEKMLAHAAAESIKKDPSGCEKIVKNYIDDIAASTNDDGLRIVAEMASEICYDLEGTGTGLDHPVVSDILEMVTEVIEQPRKSRNPADVLASAQTSLYNKWDGPFYHYACEHYDYPFKEKYEKADREYSAKEAVKEAKEAVGEAREVRESKIKMLKTLSRGNEESYIKEGNKYIIIDGMKLEKKR